MVTTMEREELQSAALNARPSVRPTRTPEPGRRRLAAIAVSLGVLPALLGMAVLTGWLWGLDWLKSLHSLWVSMKANTATLFVLSGSALSLLAPRPVVLWRRRLGRVGAWAALGIAGLTLLQYPLGIDLGIDQLIFTEPVGAVGTSHAGRMAPATAVSFIFIGSALLLLETETRRRRRPAELCAAMSGFIAYVAVLGYLYGVPGLEGLATCTRMALHTGVTLLLLTVGILASRPERGLMAMFMRGSGASLILRSVVPGSIVGLMILGWLKIQAVGSRRFDRNFGGAAMVVLSSLTIIVFGLLTALRLERSEKERNRQETRRRRAEEKVRRSEETLRAILDNAGAAIYVKDSDGRLVLVNDALGQVLHAPPAELIGKKANELLPFDVARTLEENDARVREGVVPLEFEETFPDGDGDRTCISIKFPFHGPDGQRNWLGAISTDITDRKRLGEERDRIFMFSQDLLCVASADGHFIRLNPAWERTLGYPEEELQRRPFLDFVHPDDVPATMQEFEKLLHGNTTISFENRYRCKDGAYRWLLWAATPVESEGLVYGSARDITARKNAEALLVCAKEEAEAANRELEAFSYSVSHDLRAPLRSIDGFSLALLEDCGEELDADCRRHLERVRAATQRMGLLIDDLLALSRINRKPLERVRVDASALAVEVMDQLLSAAPERRAEILIEDGLVVDADPGLLRIALENLLGNAWKFTSRREQATIRFGRTESGGNQAFFVSDNGAGFDMAHAGKLFGAFQRLHSAREFAGTGVGLATVQRVIHRHGGRIWAEAAADEGASFYFTLGTIPKGQGASA